MTALVSAAALVLLMLVPVLGWPLWDDGRIWAALVNVLYVTTVLFVILSEVAP